MGRSSDTQLQVGKNCSYFLLLLGIDLIQVLVMLNQIYCWNSIFSHHIMWVDTPVAEVLGGASVAGCDNER